MAGCDIVGLPTCEKLKLVTINIDGVMSKPNEKITMHATSSMNCPKHILKKTERSQKNIRINNVQNLKERYPEEFDRHGNFAGEAKLTVNEDAEPFTDAPRKCPIHVKDELKLEIDKLVTQGVFRKVDEHTD